MTTLGSDNRFPLVRLVEAAEDSDPTPTGEVHLRVNSSGLFYTVDDAGTVRYPTVGGYSPGGTDVAVADGGTGASTASAARTNLGLVIGTDVQAFDADIATVAASQAEAEAGTEAALRSFSPLRIAQAIAALETGGGGGGLTQAFVGKTTVGASYETATIARCYAKKITLANDCLLTDIEVYIKIVADVDAGQWHAFLWDDNGSGTAPKHLLHSTATARNLVLEESSTGPRDPRWFGLPIGRWLTAGDYWLGWQLFDTDLNIAYDTGGSDPYMSPSNPQIGDWGLWSSTNSTRNYSVRANTIR